MGQSQALKNILDAIPRTVWKKVLEEQGTLRCDCRASKIDEVLSRVIAMKPWEYFTITCGVKLLCFEMLATGDLVEESGRRSATLLWYDGQLG